MNNEQVKKIETESQDLNRLVASSIKKHDDAGLVFLIANLDKYKFLYRNCKASDVNRNIIRDVMSRYRNSDMDVLESYLNRKRIFSYNVYDTYIGKAVTLFLTSLIVSICHYIFYIAGVTENHLPILIVCYIVGSLLFMVLSFDWIDEITKKIRFYRIKKFTESDLL